MFNTESLMFFMGTMGSFFFLAKVVMSLMGADHHGHFGGHNDGVNDIDFDGDGTPDHTNHPHSNKSFTLLSTQSIFAFMMLYGWTGLAALDDYKLSEIQSMLIGLLGGLGGAFLSAWMMSLLAKMNSGSDRKPVPNAGDTGFAYTMIPPQTNGRVGRAVITHHDRIDEFDAVSVGETIPSFSGLELVDFKNNVAFVKQTFLNKKET